MPDNDDLRRKHADQAAKLVAAQKAEVLIVGLEESYREAQAAFIANRSPENHAAYKAAKQAFGDARTEQKAREAADPDHRRNTGLVFITDEEG